jgi:hypothetical protein
VSMDEDGLSVPLRYWSSREVQRKRAVEVVETWGEKPVVFQGRGDYAIITGNFRALDDPEGTFTAMDIAAAVSEMATVTYGDDGRPRPRILCYRDPKKRVLFVSITESREVDEHVAALEGIPLTLVENATDAWGVAV